MSLPSDAVLLAGSQVLVTGANGTIAAQVINQLLKYGYRVRGTVRDPQKSAWVQVHFDKAYGPGKFELVTVKDLAAEGALDEAVKGCDGVCHVASDVSFGPDPNKIVNSAVNNTIGALKAAAKEPKVKRFVLTSSSAAAAQGIFNEPYDLTPEHWNTKAIEAAWAPPPYKPNRAIPVYSASKVQAEQAMWRFMDEQKPGFVANAVLPDYVLGLPINLAEQGWGPSTVLFVDLWHGDKPFYRGYPQFMIDAIDNALLHVAALIAPDVKGERVFGYGHKRTWTDWIERLRKMYPNHTFPDPPPNEREDMATVTAQQRAENLLKWLGRPGWTPMEESLKAVADTLPAKL